MGFRRLAFRGRGAALGFRRLAFRGRGAALRVFLLRVASLGGRVPRFFPRIEQAQEIVVHAPNRVQDVTREQLRLDAFHPA